MGNQEQEGATGSWSSTEEGISVYFVVFSGLLVLVFVLSKWLHDRPILSSIFPEAGMILLVGIIAGFIVQLIAPHAMVAEEEDEVADEVDDVVHTLLSFSPSVFFIALLPPIIFNSGYHMRRDMFFRHIKPICFFACIGTIVSAVSIALLLYLVVDMGLTGDFKPTFTELLTFGGLVSATDPVSTLAVFQSKRVDPHLFYLVFGESVLNDAVGLVLFNAFSQFVVAENPPGKVLAALADFLIMFSVDFVGSLVLGIFCGICVAFLLKVVDMRRTTLLELSLYILIMYVPFLIAEVTQLSGIVTILFTGLAARRYVVPNLSRATESNADVFFRLAAHVAETSIFLELGLSVFGMTFGKIKWRFTLWAILACLIGRAFNIYPITFIFNQSLHRTPAELAELAARQCTSPKIEQVDMSSLAEEGGDTSIVETKASEETVSSEASLTPPKRKDMKIPLNTAHMLWFSGLRGAVAYACVRTFPDTFGHQNEFIVVTMIIVLVTVFILGGSTEMTLNFLNIPMGVDEDEYMAHTNREHILTSFMHGYETKYIRRCVIRDFEKRRRHKTDEVSMSPSELSDLSSSLSKFNALGLGRNDTGTCYQQHIEVTETQHFENIGVTRKPKSLYDYGGH